MNDGGSDAHGSRAESDSLPASPSPSQHYLPPKRTKVSCFPCRQRKSKCDHARPCSSCVLRGTALQCSDPSGAGAGGAASASTSSASTSIPPQHARLAAAAGASSDSLNRPLPASASMPPSPAPERANGSQQKRRRTEAPPSRLQRHGAIDSLASASDSSHSSSDESITQEMQRIKQSMTRLETLLSQRPTSQSRAGATESTPSTHDYQVDPSQDAPGETDPPSRESLERWQHLRSILPPLIDTHRMMHYILTEGDWLMTCIQAPRFIALWKYSFDRQAISDVFAVRVLVLVATSALLISDNPQRALHFNVPIRSLHTTLAKEAVRMIESMPALRYGRTEAESCDLIEIMLNTSLYFRCLGKESTFGRYTQRAISCCIRAGFDNELRPSWLGLTQPQVERRRCILMEVVLSAKWLAFHCRKDFVLKQLSSFSFGRANLDHIGHFPSLEAWPQSDHVARTIAALPTNGSDRSFAWRAKTDKERETVRTFIVASASLTDEIPAIVELASKTESRLLQPEALAQCTKEEMRDMARQTRQILARLEEWHNHILPRAGVGWDRAMNARITAEDPVEAKTMATILMLNMAVFYMNSILCRAWLLLADRLQSLTDARRDEQNEFENATTVSSNFLEHLKQRSIDHVQHVHASWLPPTFLSEVQAAVVQNGRRCIRSIPVIRTLQSLSSSQFYVGWTSQAHMQAAVNLAIPLVRSHHRQHRHHLDPNEPGYAGANLDSLRRDVLTIFEAVSQLSNNYLAHRTAKVLNRALRLGGIERPLSHADDNADGVEDAWADEERAISNVGSGQIEVAAEGLALLSAASSVRTASQSAASKRSANGGSGTASPSLSHLGWEAGSRGVAPSHSRLLPFEDASAPTAYPSASASASSGAAPADAGAREPMWWEARTPIETSRTPQFGMGTSTNAGDSTGMGQHAHHHHQQQQQQQPPPPPQAQSQTQSQPYHMTDSQLLDELLNLDASFWQFMLDGAGNGVAGSTAPNNTGAPSVRA